MTTASVAFAKYEQKAVSDVLKKVSDWLTFLNSGILDKLPTLVAELKALSESATVGDKVKHGLAALQLVATLTPNETDDAFLDMLAAINVAEVIDIVTRLVDGFSGTGAHIEDVTVAAADKTYAQAAGIPWPFLVQLALQISQLIEQFRKAKPAEAVSVPAPEIVPEN